MSIKLLIFSTVKASPEKAMKMVNIFEHYPYQLKQYVREEKRKMFNSALCTVFSQKKYVLMKYKNY